MSDKDPAQTMTTPFKFHFKIGCIILLLLVLSGCKDDEDKCLPPAISSLSYSHTGAVNGSYSVQAEVPSSSLYDHNWAMGGRFSEFGVNWILVHSNRLYESQYSSGASLMVQIHVPDTGVGKYTLPNRGLEFVTVEYADSNDGELLFEFVSGEVDVTYNQCDRIIGTFSGELQGVNDGNLVTINITDGKFDVKVKRL